MALYKRGKRDSCAREGLAPAAIGIVSFIMASLPAPIGSQDLAAFIARQPAIGEHLRRHLIASPFGTIHAATFSLPQPIGTGIPTGGAVQLVNFDPNADITGAISPRALVDGPSYDLRQAYPEVNRTLKGARLVPQIRPDFDSPEPTTEGPAPPVPVAEGRKVPDRAPDMAQTAPGQAAPREDVNVAEADAPESRTSALEDPNPAVRAARVYFGAAPLG